MKKEEELETTPVLQHFIFQFLGRIYIWHLINLKTHKNHAVLQLRSAFYLGILKHLVRKMGFAIIQCPDGKIEPSYVISPRLPRQSVAEAQMRW